MTSHHAVRSMPAMPHGTSGILVTANVDTTTCTTPVLGKSHLSILVVVAWLSPAVLGSQVK
jgi:hypothetical protein